MKALKAIGKEFKKVFEGNRCRFRRECGYYRLDSKCCNNFNTRFPDLVGSYCGTYRKIEELDQRIEKIRSRIKAERKG